MPTAAKCTEHWVTMGRIREAKLHCLVSGDKFEEAAVACVPIPVSWFSPNPPFSESRFPPGGAPQTGRWRPHPAGHYLPVVVTFHFLGIAASQRARPN